MLGAESKLSRSTSKALFGSIKELSDVLYTLMHLKILDFDHVAKVLSSVRLLVDKEQEAEVAQAVDRLFEKVGKISSQLQSLAATHKLQISQYEFKPAVVSEYSAQVRVQRVKKLSEYVERVLSDKSFREDLFDFAYLLNMEQNNLAHKVGDLYRIKTWLSAFKLKDPEAYLKIDLSNDAEATLTKVFGSLNGYFVRFGMMVTEVVKLLSKEGVAFPQKSSMLAKLEPLQLYVKALEQTYVMLLEARVDKPTKTSFMLRKTHGATYAHAKKNMPRQHDFLNLPLPRMTVKGSLQVLRERPRDQNPLITRRLAIESGRQIEAELFKFVRAGDEKELKRTLSKKVNVDVQDERGYAPLHHAVVSRALVIVAMLLQAGADPDVSSYRGTTARAMIRYSKNDELIKLLESSTNIPRSLSEKKKKTSRGLKRSKNRLMTEGERGWVTRLIEAATTGDDRALRRLIAQPDTMRGLRECLKETQGDVAKVKHGDLGQTLLHTAAATGKSDCVKTLMHHGVPVDQVDDHGDTALHLAAAQGHLSVVMTLVNIGYSDVNVANVFGMTPLILTIENNHSEAFGFLSGCERVHTLKRDHTGVPPLFQAIHRDNGKFVDKLHAAKGRLVLRYQHEPPLFTAARLGKMNSLRVLLERKEPVNEVCKKSLYKDLAPIHIAVYSGHLQAVIALCVAGADLHKTSQSGHTAVSIAQKQRTQSHNGELIKSFIDVAAKSQSLTESKAVGAAIKAANGLRAVGAGGNTAFHLAALNGQFEIVLLLVLSGFSINERNLKGETPLHVAVGHVNSESCARFFVAAGADLHAKTKAGKSVLTTAYEGGHRELVDIVRGGLGLDSVGWFSWRINRAKSLAEAENLSSSKTIASGLSI